MRGTKASAETLKRMSESMSGENHPMFGKFGKDHGSFGYKHRKDSIEKMSGKNSPMFGKKGKDHPMFGYKHTEEAKKAMSKVRKGKKPTSEHLRKNSESHKGKRASAETLKRMSRAGKALWKDPDYVRKQMKAIHVKQNKAEKKLEKILNKLFPNEWKFVGDGQLIIDGRCPDFVNVNGKKKLIELFGDYWHRDDDPQDRIDIFKPFGFDTLVIWERELYDNKEVLVDRIKHFDR